MVRRELRSTVQKVFMLALLAAAPAAASGYHVVSKIPLPGDGGWDLLTCDSQARRLYVSHSTQTQVVDIDRLTLVGRLEGMNGVHGIALAPELGRGFITAGRDNRVMIFDLKTLQSLGTVPTGENPDVILYDPAGGRVFAFNGRAQSATIFMAATGEPLITLPLGGKPEFAVADGHGSLYVNVEDKNLLLKINSRAMAVEARWPLAPCQEPSGLAMDSATNRLFAACGNKTLAVVNASSGKVVATLPIGDHVDGAVFDPETKLVITSNGEGTLTVIHEDAPDAYHVVETVATQKGARTVALDAATHRLFLPVAALGPPEPAAPASLPAGRQAHPRPSIVPGTFAILIVAP